MSCLCKLSSSLGYFERLNGGVVFALLCFLAGGGAARVMVLDRVYGFPNAPSLGAVILRAPYLSSKEVLRSRPRFRSTDLRHRL